MKFILSACLFCCVFLSYSQTSKITGTIISNDDKSPLESATVYLERVQDSSLVTYTITDRQGKFELLNDSNEKKLNLYVTYVGYQTYYKKIDITSEAIDLGKIDLAISTNALDEVVVKSRAPITIKKDTVEFNVKSFKTKKDATVEDLLKQLPGVEVDDAGKIKINGKDAGKILVNGKPFFGDDPTIATRNLTKEMIDKVQITDTKTKSEAFAGEEGDKENKTINLTIKEENNKGVFGRVAAGAGTDKRYEFAGMLNLFDNDRRVSVLAGGNNINSPGFSFGEIQKMFGNISSMSVSSSGSFTVDGRAFGGGEGITTSRNAGANYADVLSDRVEVNADYFYSGSTSENETLTERENILPDSRFFSSSNSKSRTDIDSHSANLGFDIEIDSTFLINIDPSFRTSESKSTFSRNEATQDEQGALTNQSSTGSYVDNLAKNFSNRFNLTKRFGDGGSFLKVTANVDLNDTEGEDFLTSETNFFNASGEDISRDQFTDIDTEINTLRSSVTYRIPLLAKKFFLDLEYDFQNENRTSVRSTFDRDDVGDAYDDFNFDLSTDFEYKNREQSPSLKLYYKGEKWSVSGQTKYVMRTLESEDFLRPELNLKRDFEAIEIRSNFNYRFSDKASIYTGYTLNNEAPSLNQLQPFQDVSNPLNTVTGNPNLEPTNTHRIYFSYNAFDWQKRSGFYSYANLTLNQNAVVSKTNVDPETLKRTTTYANVNGGYNLFFNTDYSKDVKIDSLLTLKYDFGVFARVGRNINFNNEVQYQSDVTSIRPSLGLKLTWKKVLEFRPKYRVTFTKNTYDIAAFDDRNFLSHDLSLRLSTFLPKNFEWRNDVDFNYNPNVAAGFQKSAWFWNSTLAYSMLKDQGTLTLKVYDLLNQNTNARRSATENYIQDSQSTVLEQYFMLSFSWKFNSLGSKGETKDDGFYFMD